MRGGQRQALMLLEGLRGAGHSCQLLARRESPLWRSSKERGFDVRTASLKLLRSASQEADLVHAHDSRAHLLAAIATPKPLVVSRRVAFSVKQGPFSQWKYRRADRFLAVSQYVARELENGGIPSDKIEVVYDGVDFAEPAREVFSTGAVAVTLASTDPQKGRDIAERAVALAQITMIFSNDLAKDLRRASQFVYLTRSEGLGSAALLAMSFSLPVIASRVGGLPEVVVDGETGLLVENEPAAVARAMRRLADDPPYALVLGRNGRRRVEQHFGRLQMVERTLHAYRKVLGVT
jgi:glycosyltransferase involved in cell wall biosynthesis